MSKKPELPTAKEARERIIKLDSALVADQWETISQAIHAAIDKSDESISCSHLFDANKARLEGMGYSCTHRQAGYNEYEWTINW